MVCKNPKDSLEWKRMKKILLVLAIAILSAGALSAQAVDFEVGKEYVLSRDEKISENLYVSGGEIIMSGTVVGDLSAAGGTILISGNVADDVLIAGGQIDISGQIGEDARIAGGNITIRGTIGGDLVVAGGNVRILSDAYIHGDLFIASGRAVVEGNIDGDLRFYGGEATVNGSVRGDVRVDAEELELKENAGIGGNLTYRSPQEATIAEAARVDGEITFTKSELSRGLWRGILKTWFVLKAIAGVIAALVLFLVFRKKTTNLVQHSITRFWPEVLRGFVGFILFPIASVILLVTVIGMPLGFLLVTLFTILTIIGWIYSGVIFGAWLKKIVSRGSATPLTWGVVVSGAILFQFLRFIPVLGWLVMFIFFLASFGTLLQALHAYFWKSGKE